MASATEAELAHARDVTITECQEHLRERAELTVEAGKTFGGAMESIALIRAETIRSAADSLDQLRPPGGSE